MDYKSFARPKIHYEDVTIGWICALTIELLTARATLDQEYDLVGQKDGDDNHYVVGAIGRHKVVMSCLDCSEDPSAAAATAVQLWRSFPNIKCGLTVGIGGGVTCWEDVDLRLGDIVVGHPKGISGGIVAFEAGKAVHGITEYRGHFNHAPNSLRNAANTLDTEKGLKRYQDRMVAIIKESSDQLADAAWPPPEESFDILHCSKSIHDKDHDPSRCHLKCDPTSKRAQRAPRSNRTPRVHRGLIASSHKVIADECQRDQVVEELYSKFGFKVLCFEMEAFSIANRFPCLVIRGISDYADSSKNDIWQRFASLSAAAYAKELLLTLLPALVEREDSLLEQSVALSETHQENNSSEGSMTTFLDDDRAGAEQHLRVATDSSEASDDQIDVVPSRISIEEVPRFNKDLQTTYSQLHRLVARGYRNSNALEDTAELISLPNPETNQLYTRGCSPMHVAARLGQQESMLELRELGYSFNDKDEIGAEPMHYAAYYGQLDIINLLGSLGCSIDVRDALGARPLHFAVYGGQSTIVKRMRELGEDLGVRDGHGQSSMHYAASAGRIGLVDYLRQRGQGIDVRDDQGRTPLALARIYHQTDMVQYLERLEREHSNSSRVRHRAVIKHSRA